MKLVANELSRKITAAKIHPRSSYALSTEGGYMPVSQLSLSLENPEHVCPEHFAALVGHKIFSRSAHGPPNASNREPPPSLKIVSIYRETKPPVGWNGFGSTAINAAFFGQFQVCQLEAFGRQHQDRQVRGRRRFADADGSIPGHPSAASASRSPGMSGGLAAMASQAS